MPRVSGGAVPAGSMVRGPLSLISYSYVNYDNFNGVSVWAGPPRHRQFKTWPPWSASGLVSNFQGSSEPDRGRKLELISYVPVCHQDRENDSTLLLDESSGLRGAPIAHTRKDVAHLTSVSGGAVCHADSCDGGHIHCCPYAKDTRLVGTAHPGVGTP